MKQQNAERRCNLLLVGNLLSPTGLNQFVSEDLADRLEKEGWIVYRTSHCQNRLLRLGDMLMTVARLRSRYQVALVDVFSGDAFVWAEAVVWVLKRLNKPIILTLHGGNLPAFAQRWPGRVRRLLQSAVLVTTPSRYLLETMQPYRSALVLLPNPIDLDLYPFRQRHQPTPTLVWLRAFHTIYNPPLAVRVLAALLPAYPDARLIMVGPDKGDGTFQATQALADQLGVADRVQFPGGVPKAAVPEWLNRGDIFLNTTNVDNTPVSVLEAMACGLPVVSTDVGGIPYLLEHGRNALLTPPNNVDAMAAAVGNLLTDPSLAAALSSTGRRKVASFSWDLILPQWEALFQRVTQEGRTNGLA